MSTTSVNTCVESPAKLEVLETEITTLAAHLNAGTYRFLALIAEFDTREGWGGWGIRSCAHWLNWKCGIGLNAAREQLRVARALQSLPHVSEAMRQGQVSYAKVRAITRVATPDNEQCLLGIARNGTANHVETVVRHYRRTKRIEELTRDKTRYEARTLRYYWDDDGCLVVEARLPPEQGAIVVQALRAADEALQATPSRARAERDDPPSANEPGSSAEAPTDACTPPSSAHDSQADAAGKDADLSGEAERFQNTLRELLNSSSEESGELHPEQLEALDRLEVAMAQEPIIPASPDDYSGSPEGDDCGHASATTEQDVTAVTSPAPLEWRQRQADAFCLMAETLLATAPAVRKAGDRHTVHVRVDLEALCDDGGVGASAVDDGPAIPPETVRRLCCDGGLVTWLHGADGHTLDVGRKTRVIPTPLRRLLERRDGGCRFPGCEQRRFVDGHHIQHWVHGGKTNADNLILLCAHHHRVLHEGGYQIRGDARAPTFIDAEGRVLQLAPSLSPLAHGDSLAKQHAARGLDLHARTGIPGWGGERADYTWILTVLDQHDRRAKQLAS